MDDLPLLELFTKLRDSGMPLGIRDYELALQALQAGYGVAANGATAADQHKALARLCRTLWVRTPYEQQLLDYHLEQLFKPEPSSEPTPKPQRRRLQLAISVLVVLSLLGAGTYFWMVHRQAVIARFFPPTNTPTQPNTPPTQPPDTGVPQPQPTGQTSPKPEPTQPANAVPVHWVMWGIPVVILGIGGWWLVSGWMKRRPHPIDPTASLPEPSPNLTSELLQQTNDEVQVAQAVSQVKNPSNRPRDRFVLSGDYLPVTQRQMKQSWRYLRRMVREGLPTELDVDATVRQIARTGLLMNPVLVPPRVNRTELVLLIDQDGSMAPFHSLSQRLVETAERGGRLGRTGIYYFHNCPIDYLYHDPFHQEAESLPDVFTQFRRDRTVVLIFSDAGAARGGFNPRRVTLTLAFLKRLKREVRYVAWLNPMPKARWTKTTAGEIAQVVPMFEANRQGMDQAIDALRGRHSLTMQKEVNHDHSDTA